MIRSQCSANIGKIKLDRTRLGDLFVQFRTVILPRITLEINIKVRL